MFCKKFLLTLTLTALVYGRAVRAQVRGWRSVSRGATGSEEGAGVRRSRTENNNSKMLWSNQQWRQMKRNKGAHLAATTSSKFQFSGGVSLAIGSREFEGVRGGRQGGDAARNAAQLSEIFFHCRDACRGAKESRFSSSSPPQNLETSTTSLSLSLTVI